MKPNDDDDDYNNSDMHSFINLYSAPSRYLLRSAPDLHTELVNHTAVCQFDL